MKRRWIFFIAVVTLINATALITMICQRWIAPGRQIVNATQEERFVQVKRELNLTPDQVEHFEKTRHHFHSGLDSLDNALVVMRQQLLDEIWHPEPMESRIDSLLARISRLQMESQHLVIWHFYRFKEVLTPEQWQKFYGIVSKRFPDRRTAVCPGRFARKETHN